MPKPIPGKQYIVVSGDTLSSISKRAYGDSKYSSRIRKANQSNLKSDDPDIIFVGEVLNIPVIAENEVLKTAITSTISGKAPDDLTVIIDGLEIKMQSTRILKTIDTISDGWSAVLPWIPGENLSIDERLKPFRYTPASVYIGNELLINGLLYASDVALDIDGSLRNLQGWSFTIDLVDSTLKSAYEKNNKTLRQIAEEIVRPFGIEVIFNSDPGGKFDKATANENETVARFLIRLARQRSLVVTSTPEGNLLFTKTTSNKNPVDIIEEGGTIVNNFNIKFDGRKRFNSYSALGQSPLGNKKGIAKDNKVPRSRFMTFSANETISGDVEKAAKWKRNGAIAEALTIPIPVIGWFDSNNNLWRENTIVTVKSKSIYILDGHDFLIKAVEYIETKDRQTAILSLVPPEVYTEDEIIEPWSQ